MTGRDELVQQARLCIDTCMNVRPGESVVILTDRHHQEFAQILADVSAARKSEPVLVTVPDRLLYQKNPPAPARAAMKLANAIVVVFDPEHGCQFWHTAARQESSEAGARIGLYFPPATWNVSEQDLVATKVLTDRLAVLLDRAREAHLMTPSGTDLRMDIANRPAFACSSILRNPGDTATIPDWGDAEVSPSEGTTVGQLVVDGSMTFIGRIEHPIRMTVERGRVTSITGEREAERLQAVLTDADGNGSNIAEFGIGTVPRGALTGHKDDRLLGTAHIALGHSVTLGGKVDSNIHLDGVMVAPTIELDRRTVMRDGVVEPWVLEEVGVHA